MIVIVVVVVVIAMCAAEPLGARLRILGDDRGLFFLHLAASMHDYAQSPLLRSSLLRFVDSRFPGNSLWT